MKKIFSILGFVVGFFFIEYFLSSLFGSKYVPNLLLLLVIFINLTLGIRYSLLAAAAGGVIKDSFGIHEFGFYIFSFILSAFMTTILVKFIYQKGSRPTLLLLVMVVCSINLMTQCLISMSLSQFVYAFKQIFIPEILSTLIVTIYTFKSLRICALKLYG